MNTFHLTATDHYDDGRNFAIVQGATWDSVVFFYPGDVSTWTPRGQIRTNYAQSDGIVKANFDFASLVYEQSEIMGETAWRTKIRPILSPAKTSALNFNLRRRKDACDRAIPGINVWVYEIELVSPDGNVLPISRGFVEVDLDIAEASS